jgi:sulfur relay (sulfurtransferase) DsrF/TusC family protein
MKMNEKTIVFLISSSPFKTLNNYEALRSTISFIDHDVNIIWKSEGVFYTLNSVDKSKTRNFLRLAKQLEFKLFVALEDLREKGLEDCEIEPIITPIENEGLLNTICSADVVFTF